MVYQTWSQLFENLFALNHKEEGCLTGFGSPKARWKNSSSRKRKNSSAGVSLRKTLLQRREREKRNLTPGVWDLQDSSTGWGRSLRKSPQIQIQSTFVADIPLLFDIKSTISCITGTHTHLTGHSLHASPVSFYHKEISLSMIWGNMLSLWKRTTTSTTPEGALFNACLWTSWMLTHNTSSTFTFASKSIK